MSKSQKIIYLVAPGLGKTTLSESHPQFLDYDVGSLRTTMMGNLESKNHKARWKLAHRWWPSLFDGLMMSFNYYSQVLVNEPSFVQYVRDQGVKAKIVVIAPADADDWISRVCTRDPDGSFCALMKSKCKSDNWIENWWKEGKAADDFIVLKAGVYLSDLFDPKTGTLINQMPDDDPVSKEPVATKEALPPRSITIMGIPIIEDETVDGFVPSMDPISVTVGKGITPKPEKDETWFSVTRKVIGFIAHLLYHVDRGEKVYDNQTCDELHANPTLAQGITFFRERNKYEKVLINQYYIKIYDFLLATESIEELT